MVKEETQQVRWRPPHLRILCGTFVLCLAGTAFSRSSKPDGRRLLSSHDLKATTVEASDSDLQTLCGLTEDDTDYRCPQLPYQLANVSDPATCCSLCEQDVACGAWSWTRQGTGYGMSIMCFLKVFQPGSPLTKVSSKGVTSGLPLRSVAAPHDVEAIPEEEDGGKVHHVPSRVSRPHHVGDLFCFAVLIPGAVDMALVEMHHRYQTSIFACDDYTLYSNVSLMVAKSVYTTPLKTDFTTVQGRDFGSPWNINVFMVVWRDVIRSGRFLQYDWTVKVSLRAVFLPSRLRSTLSKHADGPNGVYLNNCYQGLHGGLEVFSRQAVVSWGAGASRCLKLFEMECDGPCSWGEDKFIDQCLWRVLRVKRDSAYDILIDGFCHPSPDWMLCTDPSAVVFHPFEDIGAYTQCLVSANS